MEKKHKYCLRCGRELKNPEAQAIGYGKICFAKIQDKKHKKTLFNLHKK